MTSRRNLVRLVLGDRVRGMRSLGGTQVEFPYDGLEKVIISIASFKQVLSEVSLKEFGNLGKLIQKGKYFEPVYEAPTLPENITSMP
jgi:hypothetical protein